MRIGNVVIPTMRIRCNRLSISHNWARNCASGLVVTVLSAGFALCEEKPPQPVQMFNLTPAYPMAFGKLLQVITGAEKERLTGMEIENSWVVQLPAEQAAQVRQALKPITVSWKVTRLPSVAEYETTLRELDSLVQRKPTTPEQKALHGAASRLKYWCGLLLENDRQLAIELDQSLAKARALEDKGEHEKAAVVLCETMQYRRQASTICTELRRVAAAMEAKNGPINPPPAQQAVGYEAIIAQQVKAVLASGNYRSNSERNQALVRMAMGRNPPAFEELDRTLAERWRDLYFLNQKSPIVGSPEDQRDCHLKAVRFLSCCNTPEGEYVFSVLSRAFGAQIALALERATSEANQKFLVSRGKANMRTDAARKSQRYSDWGEAKDAWLACQESLDNLRKFPTSFSAPAEPSPWAEDLKAISNGLAECSEHLKAEPDAAQQK